MKRLLALLMLILAISTPVCAGELVIGLIPELNVFKQMERYKPLAAYLSEKLGVEVRLTMLSRYGNIIQSFSEGNMDAAFWGSFTGAMAVEKLGVIPLARPVALDGTSTYTGLIFVRKDRSINSVAQLKGKSFAFVDRATTAGFLYPLALLNAEGTVAFTDYFSNHYFTGSHDAAILSVLHGEADGGAAKNTIYKVLAREKPEIERELKILCESEPVPSNTLGVRKDLDPHLLNMLREALLNMSNDPDGKRVLKDFGAVDFIPTTARDYEPVFEMARKARVNLKEYSYVNK